eukprot:g5048.t1
MAVLTPIEDRGLYERSGETLSARRPYFGRYNEAMNRTSSFLICQLLESHGGKLTLQKLKDFCLEDRKTVYPAKYHTDLPLIIDHEVNDIINVLLGMEIITLRMIKAESQEGTKSGDMMKIDSEKSSKNTSTMKVEGNDAPFPEPNELSDDRIMVHWEGFPPTGTNTISYLEESKQRLIEELNNKKGHLQELLLQHIAFRQLIEKNKKDEEIEEAATNFDGVVKEAFSMLKEKWKKGDKSANISLEESKEKKSEYEIGELERKDAITLATAKFEEWKENRDKNNLADDDNGACSEFLDEKENASDRIPLPFIVVNTKSKTLVRIELSSSGRTAEEAMMLNRKRRRGQRSYSEDAYGKDVYLNFSSPFEIHDDNEIMKRLNFHSAPVEKLPELMPAELIPYLPKIVNPEVEELEKLEKVRVATEALMKKRVDLLGKEDENEQRDDDESGSRREGDDGDEEEDEEA